MFNYIILDSYSPLLLKMIYLQRTQCGETETAWGAAWPWSDHRNMALQVMISVLMLRTAAIFYGTALQLCWAG